MEYPSFINPVAISIPISGFWGDAINIYWYGISYVLGAYLVYLHAVSRSGKFSIRLTKDEVSDLIIVYGLFFGAVIGGRLGNVLFYEMHLQLEDPLYFLKIWQGGMSFHGGLIGVLISIGIFCYQKNIKFFQIMDWIAPSVPIALFFGRIANFINSELYGRPTEVAWGIIFPTDPQGLVRHPSQIYEALLEGVLLFIFLNFVIKEANKLGRQSGYFLIGYAFARSFAEIFKSPDTVYGNEFLLFSFITPGQLLCIPMLILGVLILNIKNARIS